MAYLAAPKCRFCNVAVTERNQYKDQGKVVPRCCKSEECVAKSKVCCTKENPWYCVTHPVLLSPQNEIGYFPLTRTSVLLMLDLSFNHHNVFVIRSGHFCYGYAKEAVCPPCLHPDCEEQALVSNIHQTADNECNICFSEGILRVGLHHELLKCITTR